MSTMMEYDTGPLNWVRGEIDKSLKAAQERIQAFRGDATLTNALRLARDESHQASGALRLVGLEGAATLCTAMEEVIGGVEEGSIEQDSGLEAVSNGLDGLSRWVARMAEGRGEGELALFPFYRTLRQLQGVERVFEGELFFPDLQARVATVHPVAEPSPEEFNALVKSARSAFQRGLLAFLKGVGAKEGLTQMRNALARIEAAAPSNSSRTFWWACTGFIDTLLAQGVEADFHVKQLLARIDLQMRRLLEGSPQVAERLMRDALFFIAKSESLGNRAEEVKSTFRLDRYVPKTNISAEALVRLRPLIESLKEELVGTRNAWHDHTEGKADGLARFQASLDKLSSQSADLGVPAVPNVLKNLQQGASAVAGASQPEILNLEIATTLLFLQQALESEDVFSKEFVTRSDVQCQRLQAAAGGQAMPEQSVSLMDDSSRQAREYAILAQLGQEVTVNLHRMEEILDAFFRNPESRDELPQLDQLAQQVSGALTILDQQSAAQLLETTVGMLRPFIDDHATPSETEQHRIAEAFSSLGLFVGAHCAGRADAPSILTPVLVSLGLMEEPAPAEETYDATIESGLPERKSAIASAYIDWYADNGEDAKKKCIETLTHLGQDADLIDDSRLKARVDEALAMLREQGLCPDLSAQLSELTGVDLPVPEIALENVAEVAAETVAEAPIEPAAEAEPEQTAEDLMCPVGFAEPDIELTLDAEPGIPFDSAKAGPVETETGEATPAEIPPTASTVEAEIRLEAAPETVAPVAEPASPAQAAALPEVDPELLEIFLEEAQEVLANMAEASAACRDNADDKENLTVIRRAFHTLKGSGRMVGLTDFGEVAWGMEQMMNSWLGADKPANPQLLDVVDTAHDQFGLWVDAMREGQAGYPDMSKALANASRLAKGEPLAETAPEAENTAEPACMPELETGSIAEAAAEPAQPEETHVGSITLSLGLYHIFMQEAGQRLEVLREEMSRLASDPQTPITESAARAIHTLAGIAGTAGFNIMADLAHVLELYWNKLDGQEQPVEALSVVHAAVNRLDGMLEGISQHVEPAPAIDLIETLEQLPSTLSNLPASVAILNEETSRQADLPVPVASSAEAISTTLQIEITPSEAERAEFSMAAADASMPQHEADDAPEHIQPAVHEPETVETENLDLVSDAAGHGEPVMAAEEAPPTEAVQVGADEAWSAGLEPAAAATEHLEIGSEAEHAEPVRSADESTMARHQGDQLDETGSAEQASGIPAPEALDTTAEAATPQSAPAPHEPFLEAASVGEHSAPAIAGAPSTPSPVFEQRSIQDEIDPDLLPIFLEEADILVPETAASLRAWKDNPSDSVASAALRRSLHTIKGSARMAGANRLGELTHHMETRVIDVLEGRSAVNLEVFESLESEFDRMADAVEKLHAGPQATDSVTVETDVTQAEVVLPQTDSEEAAAEPAAEATAATAAAPSAPAREAPMLRVRADWVDRMVNQAGEVTIARSRIESEMFALKRHVVELAEALNRLRSHIREVEIQAESQMQATFQTTGNTEQFDPLEFDRFTRFQEVTRFVAESVNDISTVQHTLLGRLGETEAALTQQARMSRELQQDLLRVRMVPLYSISERLYRVVRQTARDLDKRAQIDIRNGELELDRSVLEKVTAPLEHLLRNAIAHGLENPEDRLATGKPEYGEIQLSARQEGNEMVLVMKDDGAGLNMEKIRSKAHDKGLLSPGMEPTDAQLAQIIFQPGFSTADQVTNVAGRGVGMDVVKSEVAALGGRIEVVSEAGKGVTFTIYLPLTLAVTQAVIITAAKQEYALPATMVGQVQELKPEQLTAALEAGAVEWRGARYPLFYLPHLLGQSDAVHEVQRYNPVVLMKSGSSYAAFLVDVVQGAREIVVKNIGPQLARITGVAGATVQGDGRIMLILNPVPLALRTLQQGIVIHQPQAIMAAEDDSNLAPLVMVVDDSLTVRKITGRLLTREGYRTEAAKDGVDALEKMHDLTPDLVLLDVEMPRMDGFELARVMRSDPVLKHVPIIMITSRTAEKHRNHAMEIGVNMYLGKPYQEAILLDHIAKLLGEKVMQPA